MSRVGEKEGTTTTTFVGGALYSISFIDNKMELLIRTDVISFKNKNRFLFNLYTVH